MKHEIAFFDARSYDRKWFEPALGGAGMTARWIETRLTRHTALLAKDCDAVCLFVNDVLDRETAETLAGIGVKAVALRCAGFNNVDLAAAEALGISVYRVPAYAPSSVAEHALALLLTLTRKTHRAFVRTRERNFSLEGLTGRDLSGRTCGVVGTGKVGRRFAEMARGLGMDIVAFDPYPDGGSGLEYVDLDELWRRSDVVSLHCPLTRESYHLVGAKALREMRDGVVIINTSRGALIDSEALLDGIKSGKVGAAGLDVYEEEAEYFYEDTSGSIMADDTLNLLLSQPNVLVTSHQAYLTDDALRAIAETTVENLVCHFTGKKCENAVKPAVYA